MLRTNFPKNDQEADKYGGALEHPGLFFREFEILSSLKLTIEEVNSFLQENGYEVIPEDEWEKETGYESENISLSGHGYKDAIVLFIKNRKYDLTEAVKDLVEFRNEREWEQFHNSKDLAIAISLEANELLELFLWKGNEEFKQDRLEEELADVMAYCLLLAEKHGLNVSEIISRKVKRNAEKYPVSKAKGTAKKYNEL